MPGLVSTGVKRKHHALDEGGGGDTKDCIPSCYGNPPAPSQDKCSSYTMQRKYVMNASICKLQATCNLIDPSLRRSVLIRNTLLHIDHELRAEGRHQDSYQLSTFIASTQSTCTDTADKDRLPGADTNSALNSPKDNNSNHYKDAHSRGDGGATKLLTAHLESSGLLNRTSIHSCANSSLLSLSSATTLSTSFSNSCTGLVYRTTECTTNTVLLNSGLHPVTSTASSELLRLPTTNSEILDFGDELFSNIDIDLYDFDIAPPFVSSHKASPVTPLSSSSINSSSSEDWLRPVSGEYSFSSDMSSTMTTPSQGNNCRSDITCDELDQIMHVLVDVGM